MTAERSKVAAAGPDLSRPARLPEFLGLLTIVRSYWADFGGGATRSFWSRHGDGTAGRRLL
jgi:hypothetical protein